jgi:hypothetical protein
MATVLGLLVPSLPFVLIYPGQVRFVGIETMLFLLPFGVTGGLWMLFEGQTPPHDLGSWSAKLARGLVVWGTLLGLLYWGLPLVIGIDMYAGFEYGHIFAVVFFPFAGLVLSFVLASYSFFFIKNDKPSVA